MSNPNQPHQVPKLPDHPHRSFKRDDFLKKKLKCFPGPKQPPDASQGGDFYKPPLNWPKHGAVLRVPKVVWLSAYFPSFYDERNYHLVLSAASVVVARNFVGSFYLMYTGQSVVFPFSGIVWCNKSNGVQNGVAFSDGHFSYDLADAWTTTPNPGFCDDISISHFTRIFGGEELRDPWYDETIINPYTTIKNNLYNTIFPAVKLTIESRYPSTYVDIIEWYKIEDNDSVKIYDIETNIYSPHLGPLMTESCFGTDFLHLHIGYPVNLHINSSTVPGTVPGAFNYGLDNDHIFTFGLSQLERYKNIMSKYSIKMWGGSPIIPLFPEVETIPFINFTPNEPTLQRTTDMPPTNESFTMPWAGDQSDSSSIDAKNLFNQNKVNNQNSGNTEEVTLANDMIRQFAEKSKLHGDYAYMGDNGDTVTSNDLIDVIKDHWKLK